LLYELKDTTVPAITALDERVETDETIEVLTGNLERSLNTETRRQYRRRYVGAFAWQLWLTPKRGSQQLDRERALNLADHGSRAQNQNFKITLERDYAAAIAGGPMTMRCASD
jgi:hypothetical protein